MYVGREKESLCKSEREGKRRITGFLSSSLLNKDGDYTTDCRVCQKRVSPVNYV